MEVYRVTLTGIAPIKFNHPTPDAVKGLDPGSKAKGRQDAAGREAEAMERLFLLPDGTIGASSRQIEKALMDGASMGTIKIGRKSAIGYLKATVLCTDGSFGVKVPDRIVEDIVRIPPKTGALALKAWPLLDAGWQLTFELTVLQPSILSAPVARASLDSAGLLAGMATERPKYGRFTVTGWEKQP